MSLKKILRIPTLNETHYNFLYKKLNDSPDLLSLKQNGDSRFLISLDCLILGEVSNKGSILFSKYKNISKDLDDLLSKLIKGLTKDKIVNESKSFSGEEARLAGREFELLFFNDIKNRGKYFNKFIEKYLIDNNLYLTRDDLIVEVEDVGKKTYPSVSGKKTPSKADILLKITFPDKTVKDIGISLKKTPNRTQVSINSVESFLFNLEKQEKVSVPESIRVVLKKFCGVDGFTPSLLEPNREISQKDRDRYLISELESEERGLLLKWVEENRLAILNLVLFKGGVKNGPFADYLITAKNTYFKEGDFPDLVIESREDIIKQALSDSVREGKESGTVKIGAGISFQMKGSGKSRNLKTMLQFQKSPLKTI